MSVSSPPADAPTEYAALPGPRTPRIVQIREWMTGQHSFWNENAARYGPAYRVRFPFMFGRMAVFTTPSAARTVLRLKPSVAHAGRAYKALEQSAGSTAVILLDEDAHLRMRKLILPPLHGERLARWEGFCEERTLQEMALWPLDEPISLRPVTERISMAVILKIVFGIRDPARSEELRRRLPLLFDIPLGAVPGTCTAPGASISGRGAHGARSAASATASTSSCSPRSPSAGPSSPEATGTTRTTHTPTCSPCCSPSATTRAAR